MKRGEVWWVNFEPSVGGEVRKKRPAVIVSNDAANRFLNRVQVVPFTSKVSRVYPSEAVATVGRWKGKAMADQIATVSKLRLMDRLGQVTPTEIRAIEDAIRIQLGLSISADSA